MEEKVSFSSNGIAIEGLLYRGSENGVVVSHPHPLFGGNMYNPVVEAVCSAYQANGYSTFRFNFRGVGGSEGSFDDGKGEARDVLNALLFFSECGVREFSLAGYSFGARINAALCDPAISLAEMVMVSPPVAFMDFSSIQRIPALKLVVTGSRDEIAPAERIQEMLPSWNPDASLEIIQGADHFYSGFLNELSAVIDTCLKRK